MIKPDNFPFSQEVFDDIQSLKSMILADPLYHRTKEGCAECNRLSEYVFDDRYDEYLKKEFKKEGITYRAEYIPD